MIDREVQINSELEAVPPELHNEFWVQRYLGMGIIPLIIEAGTTGEKTRYDGLNNLQHALEVGHIIGQNSSVPIGTIPALQLAVVMHDTILNRQNRPVRTFEEFQPIGYSQMIHEVLSNLAEYVNEPFDTNDPAIQDEYEERMNKAIEVIYAIGIATSANKWEQAGEIWRSIIHNWIKTGESNEDLSFMEEQLNKIVDKPGGGQDRVQRLINLRENILNALEDGGSVVTPEMLDFRAVTLDFEQVFSQYGENFDLEGLIIKVSEVIHNLLLGHRNLDRPASAWRDAMELLSLYGPLVEALGFDELATLAYGTAHQYLYENSPYMKEAEGLHNKASEYWTGRGPQIIEMLGKQRGMRVIQDRVKHVGGIVDKLERGKGYPDLIGVRCLIDDCRSTQPDAVKKHLRANIEKVAKVLNSFGFELKDPRNISPIEVKNRRLGKNIKFKTIAPSGSKVAATTKGATEDRYEASHIVFVNKDDPSIVLEVQLVTKEQNYNRTGIASHVFYKMVNAIGPLGDARRASKRDSENLQDIEGENERYRARKRLSPSDPLPDEQNDRLKAAREILRISSNNFLVEKEILLLVIAKYRKRLNRFTDGSNFCHYLAPGTIRLLMDTEDGLGNELSTFYVLADILEALKIKSETEEEP